MDRARKAGAVVSLDLNLRPALWPADVDPTPRLWQALERADLVKLSREELDYLAAPLGADGEAAPRCTGTPATTTARSPASAWPPARHRS
ncbi:hypothetical protein G6F56_014119 [Rhizopus delemar]|nr:hypothetical protein G6F56_014119 [Rhizopus delemar]